MKLSKEITDRNFDYLIEKLRDPNNSDADTAKKAAARLIEVNEGDFYVRQLVAGASGPIIELSDNTQNREIGLSSLDKAKLPKNGYAVFGEIAFRYGGIIAEGAAATVELRKLAMKAADFTNNSQVAAGTVGIPKELRNAELKIEVGGKLLFKKMVHQMTHLGRDQNENQAGYYVCKIPRFIKAESEVRIYLEMPRGVVVSGAATDHHMIEVHAPILITGSLNV